MFQISILEAIQQVNCCEEDRLNLPVVVEMASFYVCGCGLAAARSLPSPSQAVARHRYPNASILHNTSKRIPTPQLSPNSLPFGYTRIATQCRLLLLKLLFTFVLQLFLMPFNGLTAFLRCLESFALIFVSPLLVWWIF